MAKDKYEGFEQNKRNKETYNAGGESLDPRYNEDFVYKHEENKITWTNEVHVTGAEANSFDSTLNQEEKGVEFEDNDKFKQNDSSSTSEASSSTPSVSSSSSTATAAGNSAGTVVHTVAVATTTAIIVVVGGGMVVNSQSYEKPNYVQIIEPYATKNTISFSVAVGNSEEDAYQSSEEEEPKPCDIIVELTCESFSSFSEERAISSFGVHDFIFDNLKTGTVYTIGVVQRTFLDLNREYIIEPLKISTIPNIPVDISTTGQTQEFPANSEFVYDGVCTVTYDDDSTEEINSSKLTVDSSQVDMTTQGKYPVTIYYTESEQTVSTSYEINVLAADITISASENATGGKYYYSEINMHLRGYQDTYKSYFMSLMTEYMDYGTDYQSLDQGVELCYISLDRNDPFSKQQIYFDGVDEQSGVNYLVLWGNKEVEKEVEGSGIITVEEPELLVCKRLDLADLEADILPVPQALTLSGQTTTYHVRDEFSFDGTASVTYDDGSTRTLSNDELYIDTYQLDMNSFGNKTIEVQFYENETNLTESYEIDVLAGDITITGDSDPFGKVDYLSEIEMYIENPTETYSNFRVMITEDKLAYDADYENEYEYCLTDFELINGAPFVKQYVSFQIGEWEGPTYFSLWGDIQPDDPISGSPIPTMLFSKRIDLPSINITPKTGSGAYVQRHVDESNPPNFEYYVVFTYDNEYDVSDLSDLEYNLRDSSWTSYSRTSFSAFDTAIYLDLSNPYYGATFDDNGTYYFDVSCMNHNESYVNAYNNEHGGSGGDYTVDDGAPYDLGPFEVDFSDISEMSVQTRPTIQELYLKWYHSPNNIDDYKAYATIVLNDPGEHYEITGLNLIDKADNDASYVYYLSPVPFELNCYEITNGHDIYDPNGVNYLDKFNGDVSYELVVNSDYEGNAGTGVTIEVENVTVTRSDWANRVWYYPIYLNIQYYGDPDAPSTSEAWMEILGIGDEIPVGTVYKLIITNTEDATDTYEFDFDNNTGISQQPSYSVFPVREGTYTTAIYCSEGGVDTLLFSEVIDYSTVDYSA